MNQPWVVPALGVALFVIGVAIVVVLWLDRRPRRRSGTSRLGGGMYRSGNAAGRRVRGGRRG